MDITELSDEQMNIILDNYARHCPNCEALMQAFSTMCNSCGIRTPFKKAYANHYVEHFELAKCKNHESSIHFCSHPKPDSTVTDLCQFCVTCIIRYQAENNVNIISSR